MIMPPGTGEMQSCGGDLFFNSEAEVGLELTVPKHNPMVCIHYKVVQLNVFRYLLYHFSKR